MGFRLVERVFTAVGVAIDLVERIRTEPPHGLNFPVAGSAAGPRQSGEFGVFTEDEVTHSAGREVRAGKPVADVTARRENPGLRVVVHRRAPVARNAQDAGPGLLESNIPQGWEEFAEALLQLPDGRIGHRAVPVEARTEVIGNAAADPTSGEVQALDDLSIQDRLDALDIDPDARHALECIWVGHANAPLNEAALSYALRWTAASGGRWRVSHEASATYRVEGGMNSLSSALAADVRGEIRLCTPVASVTQQDGFAIIETVAGQRIRARRVISTLPINAAECITFSPSLPDAWQQLSREKVASKGVKVWLRAKGRLPRFFAYSTQDAPLSVLKVEFYGTDAAGEEFTVAVGFGADASRLDATDVASVQDAVGRFGLDLQVTDVAAHDWNNDPYSMNTWAVFRPGQLTRELTSLQQSHGLLRFASGDIANLWAGHVDGAIESGLAAARAVATELRASDSPRRVETGHAERLVEPNLAPKLA